MTRPATASRLLALTKFVFFVGCSALLIWWTFRVPSEPAKLYRAIPAEASAVFIHDRPFDSWPALLENPVLKELLAGAGAADEASVALDMIEAGGKLPALSLLQESVAAYFPESGLSGAPSWIVASWLGPSSILLRWCFMLNRFPDFEEVGKFAGWSIWSYREQLDDAGLRLSVAAGEGLLLACLSPQPDGVKRAIAAYEGLVPSSGLPEAILDESERSAADKGWFRANGALISFRVESVGQESLSAVFRVHANIESMAKLEETVDMNVPAKLLGDLPSICVACPLSTAIGSLSERFASNWVDQIARLASSFQPDSNILILALLTGDYEGSYGSAPFRLRLPTILAMFRVAEGEIDQPADRFLDELNTSYRAGLIFLPDRPLIGKYRIRVLEATAGTLLSQLEPENRPAYAICEGWLIISSNLRALSTLLTRFQNPKVELQDGAWRELAREANAATLLRMDFDSSGKALQLPLTLLAAKEGAGMTRENLTMARSLLQKARRFGTLVLTMDALTPQPVFRLTIRASAEPL